MVLPQLYSFHRNNKQGFLSSVLNSLDLYLEARRAFPLYTIGKLPKCHIQKKYITNEDNIQVGNTSTILLNFVSDIFCLYISNEGFFTFIIHHFVCFMG